MTRSWQDSYPYNAVSSFALHPQFIHLPSAGVRQDASYKAMKAHLESLPAVDYEAVNGAKMPLFHDAEVLQEGEAVRVYLRNQFWGIAVRRGEELVWKAQIAPEDTEEMN